MQGHMQRRRCASTSASPSELSMCLNLSACWIESYAVFIDGKPVGWLLIL